MAATEIQLSFAVGSLAGIVAESQEWLTVAWESFGKVPSSIEALAFVRSCTMDSSSSSYCSCCSCKGHRDMLSTIDSCSGAGALVGGAGNFHRSDWELWA